MQDVLPVALQPTDDIPAKRFLSAKKSVICDVRMEEFTLKKLTALFLALLMLVSMCACAAPASTEDAYQAKVALCLVTPVNDGAWSQLAYDAVMKAKDTYNISVKYTENIKPTEMEAVFTDYASQGYDLTIGHSFSFGDAALVWGDRIFEKCGIRREEEGDGGKTLEIRGKRRLSARDGGANYQQS